MKTPARNRYGHPVDPVSPKAVRFCALGAIERALWDLGLRNQVTRWGNWQARIVVAIQKAADVECLAEHNDDDVCGRAAAKQQIMDAFKKRLAKL